MRDMKRSAMMSTFGVKDPTLVSWTRSCVSDELVLSEEYEGCTVLKPQHLTAYGRSMYTLSPMLLFLGATHTVVCEPGDDIRVYVPCSFAEIPAEALKIRGYII